MPLEFKYTDRHDIGTLARDFSATFPGSFALILHDQHLLRVQHDENAAQAVIEWMVSHGLECMIMDQRGALGRILH